MEVIESVFFGDIDYTAQERLANKIGHLDLMNVEHHGLNGGYYRPFFDNIAPKMCFTQNGYKSAVRKYLYLAERCKTHAYLQENGIPNFTTSVNETMVFNIYKSGISTKASAVKYAIGTKGVTSLVNAINDTTNTYNFNGDTQLSLSTILKNMEHGTMLQTKLKVAAWSKRLWETLCDGIVDENVTSVQLIIYKGGSSLYNQTEDGTTYPDSGYIVIIPHTSDDLIGPIFSHWYAKKDYKTINLKLKPITRNGLFEFVKESEDNTANVKVDDANYFLYHKMDDKEKENFGLDEAYIIAPKKDCNVNFNIYFRNLNETKKSIKYYDGNTKKTISLPAGGGITIPHSVNLSSNTSLKKVITLPLVDNIYVKISGTVTYSNTKSKSLSANNEYIIEDFPTYNYYPEF